MPGLQLTWMDVKIGDRVVTPRIGKPVEVQALWINALRIAAVRWSPRWRAAADVANRAFADRFGPALSRRHLQAAHACANLGNGNWAARRLRRLRHRLYKHGVTRNLAWLLRD